MKRPNKRQASLDRDVRVGIVAERLMAFLTRPENIGRIIRLRDLYHLHPMPTASKYLKGEDFRYAYFKLAHRHGRKIHWRPSVGYGYYPNRR